MSLYEWASQQTQDTWAAAYVDQTRQLVTQLAAINSLPRKKRRTWIHLTYTCRDCGEVVLEVVNTTPYRVLRYRTKDHGRSQWRFHPIPDTPAPEAPSTIVPVICRCQNRTLTQAMIDDDLAAGTGERVLPAFHDPDWEQRHADNQ